MRFPRVRAHHALLVAVAVLSCTDVPTAPRPLSPSAPRRSNGVTPPSLVISQVYGGGGNSGATLKNDFIELFNPGGASVSLAGWSVQYASAAGTTWQVTALSGSIPPGGYYLVQEAQGTGGTTALPTPDASRHDRDGRRGGQDRARVVHDGALRCVPRRRRRCRELRRHGERLRREDDGHADQLPLPRFAATLAARTRRTCRSTSRPARRRRGTARRRSMLPRCAPRRPARSRRHRRLSERRSPGGTPPLTATPHDANGQIRPQGNHQLGVGRPRGGHGRHSGLVTGVGPTPTR